MVSRRQVLAVIADMDAGENDFAVAAIGKDFRLGDDLLWWQAAARSTGKGDDTVAAVALAAILDTEIGSRPFREMVDGKSTDIPFRSDITKMNARGT